MPSLNSYIVKIDSAKAQALIINDPLDTPIGVTGTTQITSDTSMGNNRETISSTVKIPKPAKTTFTASLKLDPQKAGLQTSEFMDEVMSHLQALPDSEIEMSVEVQVKAPNGIDDDTALIVLENSTSLKVDNPQIY